MTKYGFLHIFEGAADLESVATEHSFSTFLPEQLTDNETLKNQTTGTVPSPLTWGTSILSI